MIYYEIKKVWAGTRNRLLLVGLILCNLLIGGMTAYLEEGSPLISKRLSREYCERIESGLLSADQMEAKKDELEKILQNQEGDIAPILLQMDLLEKYQEQIRYFEEYPVFLQEMKDRVHKMQSASIWKQDGFSGRNMEKTADDFSRLTLNLGYGVQKGADKLGSSLWTDCFLIFSAVYLAVCIFKQEKDNKAFGLLRCCERGRFSLGIAKTAAFLLMEAILYLLLYGSDFLLCGFFYGYGNLQRSVQSLAEFQNCGISLSVMQYLILFFIGKGLAILAISALIAVCMVLLPGGIVPVCGFLAVFAAEYLLRTRISIHSPLRLLYYWNLFGLIDVYETVRNYQNLNLLGYPVTQTACQAVILGSMALGLPFLLPNLFVRIDTESRRKSNRFADRAACFYYRHIPARILSLHLYWEGRNYMIKAGGALILAAGILVLLKVTPYEAQEFGIMQTEAACEIWVQKYEGAMTPGKAAEIEEWNAYYSGLPEQIESLKEELESGSLSKAQYDGRMWEIQKNMEQQEGFEQFYALYQERGMRYGIASNAAIRSFLEEGRIYRLENVILVLFTVLLASVAVSREYKKNILSSVKATEKGRNSLFLLRTLWGMAAVWVIVFLRMWLVCGVWSEKVSFDAWEVSVHGIAFLDACGISCSAAGWLCMLALQQALGMTAVYLAASALSVCMKQAQRTWLAGAVLFGAAYLYECLFSSAGFLTAVTGLLDTEALLASAGSMSKRMLLTAVWLICALAAWLAASWYFAKAQGKRKRKK